MRTKIALIAVVTLLALTGCGTTVDSKGESQSHTFFTFYQGLPDGSEVLCIAEQYNGAISCDWAHKIVDIGESK